MAEKKFKSKNFNLTQDEVQWLDLKAKKNEHSYGAFIGMVLNRTYEYGKQDKFFAEFTKFLKQSIQIFRMLDEDRTELIVETTEKAKKSLEKSKSIDEETNDKLKQALAKLKGGN
ncbi:MAG: hypothetical protein ACQESN_08755 [Thermotogota bacterium]